MIWRIKEAALTIATAIAAALIMIAVIIGALPRLIRREWIILRHYGGDRELYLTDTWDHLKNGGGGQKSGSSVTKTSAIPRIGSDN